MKVSHKNLRVVLVFGCLVLLTFHTVGQSQEDLYTKEIKDGKSSLFGRANSVQSASNSSQLDLITTNDQTTVNALLSFNIGGTTIMTLRASSPFEKGQNQFVPITARGISGNSSLELGFQFSKFKDASLQGGFVRRLSQLQNQYRSDSKIKSSDRITSLLDVKEVSYDDYYSLLDSVNLGTVKKYGLSINWTKQSFSFTNDLTNIEQLTEERNAITISASYGFLNAENTFYKFSLRSENYFKSARSAEFQVPTTVAGITRTEQLAVGRPTEVNDVRLRFEIQKYTGANMAINPNLNLLLESEQAIFEFPVYILRSKKNNKLGGLNGGLFASWQSDFDDISFRSENLNIGVFIGTDFDFGK